MKLTIEQYFGKWIRSADATHERNANALNLVEKVNALIAHLESKGIIFAINPHTKSIISGESYGGFRPQTCSIGAPKSAHKEGLAVDIYDPGNRIDTYLLSHEKEIADFGLWFEHPVTTNTWSHWSIRAPKSGNRFFYP